MRHDILLPKDFVVADSNGEPTPEFVHWWAEQYNPVTKWLSDLFDAR